MRLGSIRGGLAVMRPTTSPPEAHMRRLPGARLVSGSGPAAGQRRRHNVLPAPRTPVGLIALDEVVYCLAFFKWA